MGRKMGVKLYRMVKRGWVRGVLATWLIAVAFCWETVAGASDVAAVVAQVSVDSYTDYLQNDLYAHAGEERCFGPQHDLARQNIQDQFEAFGLATSLDPFAYGVGGSNVVGVLPGVIRPDEIYILGAHYDSVAGSPGAWDNASGVASVLEGARVLSQYRFEATIVFIAFDREEQGMIGSTHYAEEHRWDRIRGMICVDSLAYQPYPPEHANSKIVRLYYDTRTAIIDELGAAIALYGGLTGIASTLGEGYGSDHMPFSERGFASALLISYSGSPFYHTASDSLDTLDDADYEYGATATRGVVAYLAAQAGLAPVRLSPDLNGDWYVDIEDLTLLIEHWDQNDPSFDIAPPPLGDGTVDAQDLEALMQYWDQEIPEPGLLDHWNLDETEGMIAYDAVGANDGTVAGNPLWQPEGGQIAGAIELDGVDDHVQTAFGVDPSKRPFSVFAWVKGGGPGQVILSQAGAANWVMANAPAGMLRTELKSAGRQSSVLTSQTVITDGNWHRVGLTWDGTDRILYVDDIEVVKGGQADLLGSTGGLYIGAGANLTPGSFWSGLIDDVRLYDRAVKP
jgi:hypothetical protein